MLTPVSGLAGVPHIALPIYHLVHVIGNWSYPHFKALCNTSILVVGLPGATTNANKEEGLFDHYLSNQELSMDIRSLRRSDRSRDITAVLKILTLEGLLLLLHT